MKLDGKQVQSPITEAENGRYSPILPCSSSTQSIFDKSDTSTPDFDSGVNGAKNQAPGSLPLGAEATRLDQVSG